MLQKTELIQLIESEVKIIKHLANQLGEDHWDYKPTEGQRTVKELLQYLSYIAGTATRAIVEGDLSVFKENTAKAALLEPADFTEKMNSELAYMKEKIEGLSDDQLSEEIELFGSTHNRGMMLVKMPLEHLVAYRMQLFLYAKSAGLKHLDTWDAWRGMSNPEKSK